MIENQRQYHFTKTQLKGFELTLANTLSGDQGLLEVQLQRDAVQSEIEVLTAQITAYEQLKRGEIVIELEPLQGIAERLIQARVAVGLTQAQLAAALRLKPQQIQRYEASKYASASLARVLEVARVLQAQGKR